MSRYTPVNLTNLNVFSIKIENEFNSNFPTLGNLKEKL